jgi:uncharacterized protein involved in exopolysaccharide biosynthesis
MNQPHYFDPDDLSPQPVARRETAWLRDVVALIARHIVTLVLTTAVALVAAVIYLVMTEPTYRAQAQLLLDPKLPQIFREASDLGLVVDTGQIETHMVVLRSRAIALSVVDRLELWKSPEFQRPNGQGLLSRLLGRQSTVADPRQAAADTFLERLRVEREGISQVINVSFSSRSAETAAQIANETVNAYMQYLIDARASSAKSASDWLEERLHQLSQQMNAAAKRAQNFRASDESVTMDELQLSAETYRKTYQDFFSAFTEAVQRESYPVSTVRVVSLAVPPQQPSWPKNILLLGAALLIGLAGGLLLAIIRESLAQPPTKRRQE